MSPYLSIEISELSIVPCPMTSQLIAWVVFSSTFCILVHHYRKNGRVEGDSLAKNSLLMTCLENDQRFLSKLTPHKIIEAIFCRYFVKKTIF